MKKILTGFSVGALSLLVAGIALAQSDTTTKAPLRPAAQGVRATVVPKKVAEKMENKETRDARPLAQERKKQCNETRRRNDYGNKQDDRPD